MVVLLLCTCMLLSGLRLERAVEYVLPTSELAVASPVALKRDHSYPAPEFYVTPDGRLVLMEVDAVWLVEPGHPPERLATDPMFVSLTASPSGQLTAVGGTSLRRIRFVGGESSGGENEFLLDFGFAANQAMALGDTLLVTSGSYYVSEGRLQRLYGMATYDLRSGDLLRRFFEVRGKDRETIERGQNTAGFAVSFDVSPSGHLLVSSATSYRVLEYTLDGVLVDSFGPVPPPDYYTSLGDVAPLDLTSIEPGDSLSDVSPKDKMREAGERWFGTWTPACFPIVCDDSLFLIQRGRVPPYVIEVFSLGDRSLMGAIHTHSRLLYAQRGGPLFYLLDEASDTLLRIGGYRLRSDAPRTQKRGGRTGVHDPPGTPLTPLELTTARYLPDSQKTLVLSTTPFDCGFPTFYAACSSFVASRPEWALRVIVSYRNPRALHMYCSRLARDLGMNVVADRAYARMVRESGLVQSTPAVLAFDCQGHLEAAVDQFSQLPLDSFLFLAERRMTSGRRPDARRRYTADYFYIPGGPPCEQAKRELLRLAYTRDDLDVVLHPVCDPRNYARLRELEKEYAGGASHPFPVLVVDGSLYSGDSMLPQLCHSLGTSSP